MLNVSKLHDPNVHRNPSVLAATNLSWPQRYRYSRPIFFPFSNLLAIDTQIAIPSIGGLSSWIVQTCSSNLSPLFPYSFASPLLFSTPIGDPSFGIQLSAIRNVETGQRVNPIALPIRVVAVILKINEWGEKDSRQPRKYKSQYGRQV